MQKLQTIIQNAFKNNTAYVVVDTQAVGKDSSHQDQAWGIPFEAGEWDALFAALFRNPEDLSKGKIDIPNYGTILTLGDRLAKVILMYMPGFEVLYESEMQKRMPKPAPPVAPVVPEGQMFDPTTQVSTKAVVNDAPPTASIFTAEDQSVAVPSFDEMFASETKPAPKQMPPPRPVVATPPAELGFVPPVDDVPLVIEAKPKIALAEETVLPQGTPVLTQRPKSEISMDQLDAGLFADAPNQAVQTQESAPSPVQVAPAPTIAPVDSENLADFSDSMFAAPQSVAAPKVVSPVQAVPSVQVAESSPTFPAASVSAPAELRPPVVSAPASEPAAEEAAHLDPALSVENPPIDKYLRLMLERKASDLHVTSGQPLAFRIDGEIEREKEPVLAEDDVKSLFQPITPRKNWQEFTKISDTDFAYEIKGLARYRVNLFRDRHGMGAVLRHIPNEILSLEQLGLPAVVKRFCELNKGLVVVTGPTGSGKSTTLAAMVDYVNKTRKDHILTLEDPIEFVHQQKGCLIRQREIHKHTESFSRALRAALREDPDIILVGELRDLETTAMAIEIAETGHLVFGTLHTTTAVGTIDRVIDQFPSDQQEQIRTMLSESLRGVVSQTLLKKIGGGRVAAQEILVVNPAVSSLIREAKTHMIANHMQSQKADGNQVLTDVLASLVERGLVDPREAYLKAVKKGELMAKFKAMGIQLELAA